MHAIPFKGLLMHLRQHEVTKAEVVQDTLSRINFVLPNMLNLVVFDVLSVKARISKMEYLIILTK